MREGDNPFAGTMCSLEDCVKLPLPGLSDLMSDSIHSLPFLTKELCQQSRSDMERQIVNDLTSMVTLK